MMTYGYDLSIKAFVNAANRIADLTVRTPLLRLQVDDIQPIYLKLENLQPIGSFKIRCAANALLSRREAVQGVISTASAGNFAQGLAYAGRALGVAIRTFVPETAAGSKLAAFERLGAKVERISYADWWAMLVDPPASADFIHPAAAPEVLAGNGTIALEILQDLPDVATVLAPYGGGGLSVGIAAALRAAGSPAKVFASESQAGAPLRAAFEAGKPVRIDFDPATFITGMGAPEVLPVIWPLAHKYLAGSHVVSLEQVARAIELLIRRHHIIVEGAGGASVAVALNAPCDGATVCILSGGHLDLKHLMTVLSGETPDPTWLEPTDLDAVHKLSD